MHVRVDDRGIRSIIFMSPHMEFISTGEAPKPNARYSHAVRHGRTVYVAGWMGDDPETGKIVAGGIEAQTIRALQNIQVYLEAAGSDLSRVIRRRLYFIGLKEHLKVVDEVWGRFVEEPHPVSTAILLGALAKEDALIEIEVTAGI